MRATVSGKDSCRHATEALGLATFAIDSQPHILTVMATGGAHRPDGEVYPPPPLPVPFVLAVPAVELPCAMHPICSRTMVSRNLYLSYSFGSFDGSLVTFNSPR